MDAYELLDLVTDRESFLEFVEALIENRRYEREQANNPTPDLCGLREDGWENQTIEDFLDAAVRWALAAKHKDDWFPSEPSWRAFARFLYCGKIYE